MKIINKLIALVLFVSFMVLVYATSLIGIFSSNQKLTKVLDDSGFYRASSVLMSEELSKQINSPSSLLNEAIKNSISASITSDVAKKVIQPTQILIIEWLNNKQDKITIDLDLLPIKNKVATKSADNQIKFEITRLLPDSIDLLSESNDKSGLLAQLNRVKEVYLNVKMALPFIWMVFGISALTMFLLNIRSGSNKFNRILYTTLFASILGLLISALSSFSASSINLEITTGQGIDNFQLVTKLILTVLKDSFMTFVIAAVISSVGIIVFKVLFKSRDKHLKKKK
jgi:hypothetical protein